MIALLREHGADAQARAEIRGAARAALEALHVFRASPERRILEGLAERELARVA